MKRALIIFVRHPEIGKVKTRLAATLGDEKALSIYNDLLNHTQKIAAQVDADKFVFYSAAIQQNDIWDEELFIKKIQPDLDLGERMKAAFSLVFQEQYDEAVIIGSDCPELSLEIIEEAFQSVKESGVVVGPANDGGYYLLGMRQLYPFLFENKQWSSETVLEDTVAQLTDENISYHLLKRLTDIDTEEDWVQMKHLLL